MDLDTGAVRACFPALADGRARFDSPGGSLTPTVVADAVAATLLAGLSNRGPVNPSERRADEVVLAARTAVADLVGGDPRGVVFGRSMTELTWALARTLAAGWGAGDEVVVTRLDHDADVRPWVVLAERAGATVRWLGFDRATGELDDVATVLSERTRLVAVTGASNLIGTRPDVAAIAAAAHAVGALVHLDAVHLVPHAPVDLPALGVDLLACSPYKFFGPHHGALVASPDLLETLRPDKLAPSTDAVPERFELGTLPYELLAGTTAAVDFVAALAAPDPDPAAGATTRRERVLASMAAVERHEAALLARLLEGLDGLAHVRTHGRAARRTPTVLLEVDGRSGREVHEHLGALGINAPASNFYALEASRWLGLGDAGAVRVGLAAYSSADDVDRLLAGLARLA
ncbi:cysteine desulfurase family protein, VC1184 subfamily [Nocardioides scoriae]|uniref:Cysteine desulfurase family protein, VC1184 subfamily n=1 Tax=Nocardioides scoriae TaxID=642780 RepID=A0A1H1SLA1_9ACTN|nr:cysteine desulfurase-like protein [Nocardioides scoriae]SDS48800.1 cysteine desulfurase family protein, VC1184 subfamily [Nocardioides scoriae]